MAGYVNDLWPLGQDLLEGLEVDGVLDDPELLLLRPQDIEEPLVLCVGVQVVVDRLQVLLDRVLGPLPFHQRLRVKVCEVELLGVQALIGLELGLNDLVDVVVWNLDTLYVLIRHFFDVLLHVFHFLVDVLL